MIKDTYAFWMFADVCSLFYLSHTSTIEMIFEEFTHTHFPSLDEGVCALVCLEAIQKRHTSAHIPLYTYSTGAP